VVCSCPAPDYYSAGRSLQQAAKNPGLAHWQRGAVTNGCHAVAILPEAICAVRYDGIDHLVCEGDGDVVLPNGFVYESESYIYPAIRGWFACEVSVLILRQDEPLRH
jgi:hypothetical protein